MPELAEVVESEVVDGVIVDDEPGVSRPSVVQVVIVCPMQVVKVVAKHEHTRAAGRHLIYIPLGALVLAKRLWESRTSARYERFIQAARVGRQPRGRRGQ